MRFTHMLLEKQIRMRVLLTWGRGYHLVKGADEFKSFLPTLWVLRVFILTT